MRRSVLAHLRWDYPVHTQTGTPILSASAYRPLWTHDTPVCEVCWLREEYIHPEGIDGLASCPWEQLKSEPKGKK